MNNFKYYSVYDSKGKKICDTASLQDALMMVQFDSENRTYREQKFILDQVIDVTSTTDKQLPGQIGLPEAKEVFSEIDQKFLPDNQGIPLGLTV